VVLRARLPVPLVLATAVAACSAASTEPAGSSRSTAAATATPITSPIPAARLAAIKSALPRVAWPRLAAVFADASTYWYDHASMQPSYQETGSPGGGARDNAHWHDLIADTGQDDPSTNPETGAKQVYDEQNKHWKFPVATTAGTDQSTNFVAADFLSLPKDGAGAIVPIPISTQSDDIHKWWDWKFPNGTIVGEVIFVQDGSSLLPTEVRLRQRFPSGWAVNSFRPFPEASALSAAIEAKRPSWSSNAQLAAVVAQLDGTGGGAAAALTPLHLTATGLTGSFDQAGYVDTLPDFGDDALVRDLLTSTTFVSAYQATWRSAGGNATYAASTASNLSIVPSNYQAGIVEVSEASCARCHEQTAKPLANWYPGLTLYGNVWGTDNVFTFHVFDESYYPSLDLDNGNGVQDNRHMNPALVSNGMIVTFDPSKHTAPPYYDRP
jgi:hypothetical protein